VPSFPEGSVRKAREAGPFTNELLKKSMQRYGMKRFSDMTVPKVLLSVIEKQTSSLSVKKPQPVSSEAPTGSSNVARVKTRPFVFRGKLAEIGSIGCHVTCVVPLSGQ